jgi:hypothetical protein
MNDPTALSIPGSCHCGNLRFTLDWPGPTDPLPARACSCSFCQKHGGVWTAHPAAALVLQVGDPALHQRYRFGTQTADFHVCTRCGAAPFVTCVIDGHEYAVVSVRAFDGFDPTRLAIAPADFDGEGTDARLERRRQRWIGNVRWT